MFKGSKNKVTKENTKKEELKNDETHFEELHRCLVKLNLILAKNVDENQLTELNELKANIKRLHNQLDEFINQKQTQNRLDYASILRLVDSSVKDCQNLKSQMNQFQLDSSDLEFKENYSLQAHLHDAKALLAKLSDEFKIQDTNQLSYQIKELEQRFAKLKSENEQDSRIENILYQLNSQTDQNKKYEYDLNYYKRDLQELRLNSFRNEFEKLYEKFAIKLELLYTDDYDDPVYSLNDLIASIVELKESILNYEQFALSISNAEQEQISNLEDSRKQILEDKNEVDANEKNLVIDALQLGIQAKQNELTKIKQIKLVKDKILNLEKIFCELKAGLE